ncbi:hypothetical protein [Deinococcus roseus]|uniref:hypothetical protein n=1 Tax=Deinococcus roseus TaxID=392414 RepID=UPI0016674A65|nr:hypothetical protein [Deinococcus roseus]
MLQDTYDLHVYGTFSLDKERLQQIQERRSELKFLPANKSEPTPEFMGLELDVLQAIYLCRSLKENFKIVALPTPIRYWVPQISEEEAFEIAKIEHLRVIQNDPELQLGPLTDKVFGRSYQMYGVAYGFNCANIKAQLAGYVPGTWWVHVDMVDGTVWTDNQLDARKLICYLARGDS